MLKSSLHIIGNHPRTSVIAPPASTEGAYEIAIKTFASPPSPSNKMQQPRQSASRSGSAICILVRFYVLAFDAIVVVIISFDRVVASGAHGFGRSGCQSLPFPPRRKKKTVGQGKHGPQRTKVEGEMCEVELKTTVMGNN